MINKAVKDKAAKKAKLDGLSLSTVAKFLLQGYADGKVNIGLIFSNNEPEIEKIPLDAETQKMIDGYVEKWRNKFAD